MAVELPDTQEKVVELLGAIKRLPNLVGNGEEYEISSVKIFSDLGYFETDFADSFRGILPRFCSLQILIFLVGLGETLRSPDSVECASKWARINAFAARLTTSLVKDLRHRALETIKDALNDKYLKERRTSSFCLPPPIRSYMAAIRCGTFGPMIRHRNGIFGGQGSESCP